MWKNKRSKSRKVARQATRKGKYRRDQDSKHGQLELDRDHVAYMLLCSRFKVQ